MKNIIIYLMISVGLHPKEEHILQRKNDADCPHHFISLFDFIIIQIRNIDACNVCKGFNEVDIFISTDIKQES